MADSGSGVGAVLDPVRFVPFVNADLSVSLHRLPDGEWIGLDSVTTLEPHGVGLTRTGLYDVHGAIGQGLQALVAGRMDPPVTNPSGASGHHKQETKRPWEAP